MNGNLKEFLKEMKKTLYRITKTCSALEKRSYYLTQEKPFIVVRAAGSFGVDLVALRGDISFLIEIKSSNTDILHFSSMDGKLQLQAEKMQRECEKTRTLPVYGFRLKGHGGDSWRLFTMEVQQRLKVG